MKWQSIYHQKLLRIQMEHTRSFIIFLSENLKKVKLTYPRVKIRTDQTIEIMDYTFRNPNVFPFDTEVLQKSDEDKELYRLEIIEN